MTSIVLTARGPLNVRLLSLLRELSGASYLQLKTRAARERPIWWVKLFGNDHGENAARLRRLLGSPESDSLNLYEVDADAIEEERWTATEAMEITPVMLLSLLAEHDRIRAQLDR